MQATRLTFSDPPPLTCCCHLLQHWVLHPLPLVMSSTARLPCIVRSSLLLCRPPSNCFASCPLPPSSCCVVGHPIALRCVLRCPIALHHLPPAHLALSAPPPLVVFSAAPLPCTVYLPLCRVIHCLFAPYTHYLNLIVAFILLSLSPPPHCLLQRLLNVTSTMERLRPSLPLNIVFICHRRRFPFVHRHRQTPPAAKAIKCHLCCHHFAVLSSSVTATTFPVVHHHRQTPLPAIATCCTSRQMPFLLPPPFASSIAASIKCL